MYKHLTSNSTHVDDLSTERFPATVYREAVLATNFADAKRLFLSALLHIEYAHTIMLERAWPRSTDST